MAQIRCGHCQGRHQTVEGVRRCAIGHDPVRFEDLDLSGTVTELHSCEDFDGECYVEGVDAEGNETYRCPYKTPVLVHQTIEQVIAEPVKVSVDEIPGSKYALADLNGKLHFFEVQIGKGKWAGRRFVKRLIGAPGDWDRLPMAYGAQQDVMNEIVNDVYRDGAEILTGPLAGAVRFSREHTVCAACMSPLSDEDSVARGLGPICAKKFAA